MLDTRQKIVAAARAQIGRRCRPRRASSASTIDCAGFIREVASLLDLDRPAPGTGFRAAVHRNPTPVLMRYFDPKSIADLEPGDLLVFKFGHRHHLGVATELFGAPAFVHAYDKERRVVEVSLDRAWRHRLAGCYAFRRAA